MNQIWRDAKIRAVGKKRAQTLVEAARHSVGTKEGATAARIGFVCCWRTMNPETIDFRK